MPRARNTGKRLIKTRSSSHKEKKGYLKAFRIKLEIKRLRRRIRDLTDELREIEEKNNLKSIRHRR